MVGPCCPRGQEGFLKGEDCQGEGLGGWFRGRGAGPESGLAWLTGGGVQCWVGAPGLLLAVPGVGV